MIINNDKQEYANQMETTARKVLRVIGIIILGVIFVTIFGFVIKALWNWLMPEIFNLGEITYWQGMGILVLSKILFGGFSSNNNTNTKVDYSKKRGVVGHAIHEEMQKEFYKEYDKKHAEQPENDEYKEQATVDNSDQEKLYDEWWAKEGEAKFDEYLRKTKKNNTETDSFPEKMKE